MQSCQATEAQEIAAPALHWQTEIRLPAYSGAFRIFHFHALTMWDRSCWFRQKKQKPGKNSFGALPRVWLQAGRSAFDFRDATPYPHLTDSMSVN